MAKTQNMHPDQAFQDAVQSAKPAKLPPGPIPVPGRDYSTWVKPSDRKGAK